MREYIAMQSTLLLYYNFLIAEQRKIVLYLTCYLSTLALQAQPPLSYAITRTTANVYQSIAPLPNGDGTGIVSKAGYDEETEDIFFPAGFNFSYQGSSCSGFSIHANGYISLRNTLHYPSLKESWDNTLAGSSNGVSDTNKRNVVAPFYEDLYQDNPVIYYKFSGNKATVEWYNTTFYALTGPQMYFQVILDGSDNSIQFNYGNMQLFNGTRNIRYSYTCGLSGASVDPLPAEGQVLQQQYENSTYFSNESATTPSWGANGLCISPEPRSSIKFTPGTYVQVAPPPDRPPGNDDVSGIVTGGIYDLPALKAFPDNIAWNSITNRSNFFTTRNATHSPQPVCAGPADAKDVWFKFNANNPDMTVRVYASGGFIPAIQLLDSALNPLTSPVCEVSYQGNLVNAFVANLVIGAYYYVRVYHNLTGITAKAVPTISNGSVTGLIITNGTNYTVPRVSYDDSALENRGPVIRFTGGGGTGAAAAVVNVAPSAQVLATMGISNISFVGGKGYTSPPTVIIESPDWGITGEFAIIVHAKSANDDCAEATSLTDLTSAGCDIQTNSRNGNTLPATASAEAEVCGVPDDDVWYKFTAVTAKTFITISGHGSFNPAFEIFDGGASPGDCATKTSMRCIDSTGANETESMLLSTAIGNTYFIRVYHAAGAGLIPGSTFNICVSSALPACINAPLLPADGNSTCRESPLLQWPESPNATGYLLYVDSGAVSATTLVATITANTDTSFAMAALPPGKYSWRVVPVNGIGQAQGCPTWTFNNFPAAITITATPSGPLCLGTPATFTAATVNAGLLPGHQWTKNGLNIEGATTSSYISDNLVNNDTIRCVLTASTSCNTTLNILSNAIIQQINVPVTMDTSLIGCNIVTYRGITYTSSTIKKDTVKTVQGCDSIYTSATITVTNIPSLPQPSNLLPINNSNNLNTKIIFSWAAVPNALLYDLYIWKSSDPVPGTPVVANISDINYTCPDSVLSYGTAYNWKVAAKHDACSTVSAVQSFTTRFLPDLIVMNIQNPSTAFSGQSITVQWQVTNTGQGGTLNQQWFDVVYLSKDTLPDATDQFLGSARNSSELPPGKTYAQSGTFTLPDGINESYYLFVVANAYKEVRETDQTNNTAHGTIATFVQLAPPADLQVTSIVPPNFIFSGDTIDLAYTVANNGSGPTVTSSWYDYIYLSKDSVFTGSSVLLESFSRTEALAAGANYTKVQRVRMPQGLSGKYYFFVRTDVWNNVYEHAAENNNTGMSDSVKILLTPPVDLVVTQIIIPASANNNDTVLVKWRIENSGGSATQNIIWNDYIFLSKSRPFDQDSAILLGNTANGASLSPGEGYDAQTSVMIPSNVSGNYYVYVNADFNNRVYEHTFENNNNVASNDPIKINSPDLVVSEIVIPSTDSSGKIININWTIKNIGNGVLSMSNITDRVSISKRSTYHPDSVTEVGRFSYNTGPLLKGDSLTHMLQVQIPNGISGNYYIYINTEDSNTVYEANENNNLSGSTSFLRVVLSPSPDLLVTSVVLPDTSSLNEVIPLVFTVKNNGAGNINNANWTDRIYLSRQAGWPAPDSVLIREIAQAGPLGINATYSVNGAIKVPANLVDSSLYYLHIVTDATNSIYEHNAEANNYEEKDSLFIKKYPAVDLAVTNITAPATGSSGKRVAISWTVINYGQVPTLQSQWQDGLYLSIDSTWNKQEDILIKEITHNGNLPPGKTYLVDDSIVLPNGISGQYYLLMVADHNDFTSDVNKSNNYKIIKADANAATITIALTPPPDLVVTSFTIPLEGGAGQPIMAKYTITNTGPGVVNVSAWTDKIYLSTNPALDTNDLAIGSKNHTLVLNTGESYIDSVAVFLPIAASGNYAVIIKTDNDNAVYEHTGENNNLTNAYIIINVPPLSDLAVSSITLPSLQAEAGEPVTINWTVKNIGANPSKGYMKEVIYLSEDTVKDVSDILIANLDAKINLAPQTETSRTFTGDLKGVALKDYHVLVHTDVLNNIYESSDSNNIAASMDKLAVQVALLPINIPTVRSLDNDRELYYRIVIPDSLQGESLLISLEGDSINGINEMYARFGDMPTKAVYDFSHAEAFGGNQAILVASLKRGTYYLMLTGKTPATNAQQITVLARILQFEIRSVNASKGGNTGNVTVQINGSKFSTVNAVKLIKGNVWITAERFAIVDPAMLYATFNLNGAQPGDYDVVAINKNGDSAVLKTGFEVVAGTAPGLITSVVAPPGARPSNVIAMSVEFTNGGNTDLIGPVLKLTSLGGAPISFSIPGLADNRKELTLSLHELNGPAGILRPGASGTIIVYSKAISTLAFTLMRQQNK